MHMILRPRAVTVEQVPERFTAEQERIFFRKLQDRMNHNRPCVVLDCSRLGQMDKSVVHLLLSCLEEAMKRNGDVRLAALPPQATAILASTGADRLFRFFDSTADAVNSFCQRPVSARALEPNQDDSGQVSQNAA